MKKILLTGGSGMVGHNLLEHPKAKRFNIQAPSSKEFNLLNSLEMTRYLEMEQIDMVVHCAGHVGGIQANIQDPVKFLNNNLLMGINLVNAAHAAGIQNFLNLGSSCMYPKDYHNPLKEEYILSAPLEPTNEGYAIAKIAVAKLCEYMHRQYGVNYKTLIPCNLYGRWDKFSYQHSHMIPAVIQKIHLAKTGGDSEVEIWGSGESRREFMFALDCADAIFFAIDKFDLLDDYTNIGLGYDFSINEYYQMIAKVVGYTGKFVHDLSKPSGMSQKLIDISKMNSYGWIAQTKMEDGLAKTYKFYLGDVE
jgi:GDP-L-fucose synthase